MNKAAFITGSAKRIGKEIAISLASQGFDIAISYNKSREEAIKLKSQITKQYSNIKCEVYQYDLAKKQDCLDLMKDVLKDFPDLSILINNASIFDKSDFSDDIEDYEENMAIHVTAPIILAQEFTKHVSKNKIDNANIINMTDRSVTRNKTVHFYYLLSKKTLNNLTKMLATKLAPEIRVNAVAPGYILDDQFIEENQDLSEKIINDIPLKRKGSVKNITQAIDFIIENDFINGQTLFIDGGSSLINK